MPTLKETEASLSYAQCFLYLDSSVNVSFSCYMIGCLLDRPRMSHRSLPISKMKFIPPRIFSQGFPFSMTNTNDHVLIKARNLN